MKMIYEEAIEVNKNLQLNCDKQIYNKYLKEQCDMDDDNEVQEITAARNSIKKALYMTCYQTFAVKNGLKIHVHELHIETW